MSEILPHVSSLRSCFSDVRHAAKAFDRGEPVDLVPRIDFEGVETLLEGLTPNRWALLCRLRATGPSSIRALAAASGRDCRGVHADVTALLPLDLVMRDAAGKISVPRSKITAELKLEDAA